MPSSIFNFKPLTASRAMALLLAGLVLYFGVLEIVARTLLPQFSRVQRDYYVDANNAYALYPVTQEGTTTALIVGNSLLRAGVNRELLRRAMAPAYSVVVFPVDSTFYWDWFFGLRRLFAAGACPAVVVLSLTPEQLLSNSTNGERFARFMMRLDDLPQVQRIGDLDMTETSEYFFAHLSGWLGGRWEIRNWVLARLMPDAAQLAAAFTPKPPAQPTAADIGEALQRLVHIRRLVESYGSQFVFSMPPSLHGAETAQRLQLAAQGAGIPVLMPYRPGEMPADRFTDGAHLDAEGAELYTERLQTALHRVLAKTVPVGFASAAPKATPIPVSTQEAKP